MVSKVAVIALVAIVACPILLGYGMNLQETTSTEYVSSEDPVNVTQLLQNGTGYSYANADILDLNTLFNNGSTYMPDYKTFSYTKSSLALNHINDYYGWHPVSPRNIDEFTYLSYIADYTTIDGSAYITVHFEFDDESIPVTISMLHSLFIDYKDANKIYYTYYYQQNGNWRIHNPVLLTNYEHVSSFQFGHYGTVNANVQYVFHQVSEPRDPYTYVNIADGFYLNRYNIDPTYGSVGSAALLPQHTKSLVLTVDLSTISDSNYYFNMYNDTGASDFITIKKTTDSEGAHWSVYYDKSGLGLNEARYLFTDLYYDSSKSSNTYQILISNTGGIDFNYVGSWPTLIGIANSYLSYHYDWHYGTHEDVSLGIDNETPLMRIDSAQYIAFEYPVIENETYNPYSFRVMPATTINDVVLYGTSFTFGGNTYPVTKGNISIGSHEIPVKGLVLSSVPAEGGGYDNKIGNTVISTTAEPSTITFNGQWSANVSTVSLTTATVTTTQWKAGEFAWDGIDHNFLMVGLLTSLGAFIALGIYIRRTKANLWPLLVVCGGAAMLFFCML